jgi:hypothetical protein
VISNLHKTQLYNNLYIGKEHSLMIILYGLLNTCTLNTNQIPLNKQLHLYTRAIRLFRIISIPSKFCYFRPPDHVILMD